MEKYKFTVTITTDLITPCSFTKNETTLYKNTEHYFTIKFKTVNPVNDNWAFKLTFSGIKL